MQQKVMDCYIKLLRLSYIYWLSHFILFVKIRKFASNNLIQQSTLL